MDFTATSGDEILAQQESLCDCQGIYLDIMNCCVITSSLADVPKWQLCFPGQELNYTSVPEENFEEQVPIQETTE